MIKKLYWDKDSKAIIWIIALFVLVFILTYSRWGLIIIDCFREFVISRQMLDGKILYKDIHYVYGPFVPYFQTFLLGIFGYKLSVIYFSNGIITLLYSLIIFFIARQLLDINKSLYSVFSFWAICAFVPGLKSYLFPYTASASFGSFFAILTFTSLLCYLTRQKESFLYFAAILGGLTFITKHESALAILLTWITTIILSKYFNKSLLKSFVFPSLVLILIPFSCYFYLNIAIGFKYFKHILMPFDMLKSLGYFHSNFMKAGVSIESIANGGLWFLLFALASVIIILLSYQYLKYKEKNAKKTFYIILLLTILPGLTILYHPEITEYIGLFMVDKSLKFFTGINFIIILTAIYAIKNINKNPTNKILLFISLYSIFASARTPFYMWLGGFSGFYIPTGIIIITYLYNNILPNLVNNKLDQNKLSISINMFLAALLMFYILLDTGKYVRKNYVIKDSHIGKITVENSLGPAFNHAIDFIKENTSEDDFIFVVPEEISYYALCNRKIPAKYPSLNPGFFLHNNKRIDKLISSLNNNKPELVLVSNLPLEEYGKNTFNKSVLKLIQPWINDNYIKAKTFKSTFPIDTDKYYEINIYKSSN
ncbi:MAG: glycosyltransferase family 39 protein [Cyanobacteriota bacterium]